MTRAAGLLAVGLSLLVAACSGATSSGAPSAASAGAAASAPAVSTPASSSAEDLPSLPIALPSFDIGALTQGLANVDSYKVSITTNGEQGITGTVVTKPVLSRDYTLKDGTRVVVIGDKAWIAQPGGALTSVPSQMGSALFAAFDPTLLVGAFSGLPLAQGSANLGKESKNGLQATHYHVDSTTGAGLTGLPAGAKIDLWIADEGYLVGLEATGLQGGDVSIQVTNVNDPANKIVAPS